MDAAPAGVLRRGRRGAELHPGRGAVPRGAVGAELPDRPAGTGARRHAVRADQPLGRLAPAGELLLPRARRILAELDAPTRRAGRAGRGDHRTAAARHDRQHRAGRAGGGAGPGRVPPAPPRRRDRHQDTGSRQMAEQVRAGGLDLAFVGLFADQVPADLAHRVLADEPLVAVVPRRHPLAGRSPIGLAELAGGPPFVEMRAESGLRSRSTPRSPGPAWSAASRSSWARPTPWCGSSGWASGRPSSRLGRSGTRAGEVGGVTSARSSPIPRPGTRSASCTADRSPPRPAPARSSAAPLTRVSTDSRTLREVTRVTATATLIDPAKAALEILDAARRRTGRRLDEAGVRPAHHAVHRDRRRPPVCGCAPTGGGRRTVRPCCWSRLRSSAPTCGTSNRTPASSGGLSATGMRPFLVESNRRGCRTTPTSGSPTTPTRCWAPAWTPWPRGPAPRPRLWRATLWAAPSPAILAARRPERVAALVLLEAPLRFGAAGRVVRAARRRHPRGDAQDRFARGGVPGAFLDQVSALAAAPRVHPGAAARPAAQHLPARRPRRHRDAAHAPARAALGEATSSACPARCSATSSSGSTATMPSPAGPWRSTASGSDPSRCEGTVDDGVRPAQRRHPAQLGRPGARGRRIARTSCCWSTAATSVWRCSTSACWSGARHTATCGRASPPHRLGSHGGATAFARPPLAPSASHSRPQQNEQGDVHRCRAVVHAQAGPRPRPAPPAPPAAARLAEHSSASTSCAATATTSTPARTGSPGRCGAGSGPTSAKASR